MAQSTTLLPVEIWLAATTGLYRGNADGSVWKKISNSGIEKPAQIVLAGMRIFALSTRDTAWTDNRGVTWHRIQQPRNDSSWNAIAATGNTILAATSHGLFRSTNAGLAWTAVEVFGRDSVSTVQFHTTMAATAFAAQYGKIFVTRDSGVSWSELEGGPITNSVRSLAVVPALPHRLFALVEGRGTYSILWENQE
jgi:hypothetical protein